MVNSCINSLWISIAYVEGRDEVDRGASHQSLTQVIVFFSFFFTITVVKDAPGYKQFFQWFLWHFLFKVSLISVWKCYVNSDVFWLIKLIEKNFQDFFMVSSGKRKRDDLSSQYQNGQHIPQQDGAMDTAPEVAQVYFLFSFLSIAQCHIFLVLKCEVWFI